MNWFKFILTYIAAANMVLLPLLAHAEQIGPHYFPQFDGYSDATLSYRLHVDNKTFVEGQTQKAIPQDSGVGANQSRGSESPTSNTSNNTKNTTKAASATNSVPYELHINKDLKKAIMLDPYGGFVALEVPFTPTSQLRRFEPKELNKYLAEQMAKVTKPVGAAFNHTMKALPAESAIFFMAMGAVVAAKLFTDYSSNPLGGLKHIEHHMSPLGTFGFGMFMLSQGITSNLLPLVMKNPKYHFMIPYMGMAVGAFVQSYLTQFVSDPNVRTCAMMLGGFGGYQVTEADLKAGVDQDPCGKAYEYIVLSGKIWEFAPGIASVILSAGIAAVGQKAIGMTLKAVGINLALLFVPGRIHFKGMGLLAKGMQIAAWGTIDMIINRWVTTHWKNVWDGKDLFTINSRLSYAINMQKQSGWSGNDKEHDPNAELKKFTTKMAEWRMMNLSEVYESHQMWSENILRLMQLYNSSEKFYSTLVDEVHSETFKKGLKTLELSYPFNGVLAKDMEVEKQDLYYTQPLSVQSMQINTINDAVKLIDEDIIELNLKAMLVPHEFKALVEIRNLLAQENELLKVDGLNALNRALEKTRYGTPPTQLYMQMLYKVRGKMGDPIPMMEPGRGFLATYEKAPLNKPFVEGVPFYRSVGRYSTAKLTDSLLMWMVCGPDVDKKQSSVKFTRGFYTVFIPPHIRNGNHDFTAECESYANGALRTSDSIYNDRVNQDGKQHKGFLQYIKNNIRPEILGEKYKPGFADWWKTTTESQMITAFAEYENYYTDVIAKLLEGVKTTEMRSTNMGPIANGAMLSIIQQSRIYLGVLDDLLSNSPKKFELFFSQQGYFTEPPNQAPKSPMSLKVEREFNNLYKMFNQIKVDQQNGKNIIVSSVENAQLEEQLKAIQTVLAEYSEMLGADKKSAPASVIFVQKQAPAPSKAVVKLSEAQIQLAVTALEGLQSIATEILMYGSIANAVTWSKIRELKKKNPALESLNKMVEEFQGKNKSLVPTGSK